MFTLAAYGLLAWFLKKEAIKAINKYKQKAKDELAIKQKANDLAEENVEIQKELLAFYKKGHYQPSQEPTHEPAHSHVSEQEKAGYRYVVKSNKKAIHNVNTTH